jgi:hypothetical protein
MSAWTSPHPILSAGFDHAWVRSNFHGYFRTSVGRNETLDLALRTGSSPIKARCSGRTSQYPIVHQACPFNDMFFGHRPMMAAGKACCPTFAVLWISLWTSNGLRRGQERMTKLCRFRSLEAASGFIFPGRKRCPINRYPWLAVKSSRSEPSWWPGSPVGRLFPS